MTITLSVVNGKTLEVSKNGVVEDNEVNRMVLERNALDFIDDGVRRFDDCQCAVEEASVDKLLAFIAEYYKEEDNDNLDSIIYRYFGL